MNDLSESIIEFDEDFITHQGDAELTGVAFNVFSNDEVRRISVAEIKESKLSGEGSVYDERLGVIQNHVFCITCKKDNQECAGHCGHIELPVPIPHPMYSKEIMYYLKCFCSECSSLLMNEKEIKLLNIHRLTGESKFKKIIEYCENKVRFCPICEVVKYSYFCIENKYSRYIDSKTDSVPVSSKEIENILGGIKSREVDLFGLCSSEQYHPVDLIMNVLLVLPICARPFVETSRGSCEDDLTNKYIDIIKVCNKLKNHSLKETDYKEAVDNLEFHIRTLMYNHKQKAKQISGRPIRCLRERINGKGGLVRCNLSGKRGDFTARTVIGPDPRLRADEIAIPEEFAEQLTFPEIVNNINLQVFQKLVDEGKVNTVKRDGKTCNLKINTNTKSTYEIGGFNLEQGDTVIREGKKIDPAKYKEVLGKEIILLPTDRIARKGKILKGVRPPERVAFELQSTDMVIRNGNQISPFALSLKEPFSLREGDRVFRKGKELKNILPSQKRQFKIKLGDTIERQLRTGDYVLFGRQPT